MIVAGTNCPEEKVFSAYIVLFEIRSSIVIISRIFDNTEQIPSLISQLTGTDLTAGNGLTDNIPILVFLLPSYRTIL